MGLDKDMEGFNPKRTPKYNIKGIIGREQLRLKYCAEEEVGRTRFTNLLNEIEEDIQEVLPRFKVKGKKRFTIREQELIFDLIGAPPGYEI